VEAGVDRPLAIDMWYEPWPNVFPTWREQWDCTAGRVPMTSWGTLLSEPSALDAFRRMGQDAWFNPPPP
jgi:hypothetical protein